MTILMQPVFAITEDAMGDTTTDFSAPIGFATIFDDATLPADVQSGLAYKRDEYRTCLAASIMGFADRVGRPIADKHYRCLLGAAYYNGLSARHPSFLSTCEEAVYFATTVAMWRADPTGAVAMHDDLNAAFEALDLY